MVSVVIVTRNTAELLAGLLASIGADRSFAPFLKEVIVVDNGSTDTTEGMVRDTFQKVVYIRNEENRGFAAAVNAGVSRSSEDLILFLNSDTRLIEGEIVKMVGYIEEHAGIGIAGPQLVYPDLARQRSFASAPSLLLEIVPRFFLERIFPRRFPGKKAIWSGPGDVNSLIGAAILVKREVLEATGGFDERFFFFLEETDLCVGAREKGYRVSFFPGTRVIHHQGETVRRSWVRGRIEYNISLYKFIKKHHGRGYYLLFAAVRFVKNVLVLVLSAALPFLFAREAFRRRYGYYLRLLLWHLKGCPDTYGLRPGISSPG